MKKVVNITDRISKKQNNPRIKIGKTILEINSSTPVRLRMKQIFDKYDNDFSDIDGEDVVEIINLMFSKKTMDKIIELGLSDDDFGLVITTAMELLADGEEVDKDSKN